MGVASVALVAWGVVQSQRSKQSEQPSASGSATAAAVAASGDSSAQSPDPPPRETARKLVALARAHHAKSAQARAAFAEVARENASLRPEQLELVEGALLHAGAEYFDEGFVTARRWGLRVAVNDSRHTIRVTVRPTDARVSTSWGLAIDAQTGAVRRTFTAAAYANLAVSLPPEYSGLLPALRRCYGRALALDSRAVASGDLLVSFHLDGTVRQVELETKEHISRQFERCVREAVRAFPFNPPDATSVLRVPVAFVTD